MNYTKKNLEQKRRNFSEMEIRHGWEYWREVTKELERTGKLDTLDALLSTTTKKDKLYNELLSLADTIEEVVVMSYYVGYRIGYEAGKAKGMRVAYPEWEAPTGG